MAPRHSGQTMCQLNSQGQFMFFTMGGAQKKGKCGAISVYICCCECLFFPCFGLRSDPNQLCYGTDTFVFFFLFDNLLLLSSNCNKWSLGAIV